MEENELYGYFPKETIRTMLEGTTRFLLISEFAVFFVAGIEERIFVNADVELVSEDALTENNHICFISVTRRDNKYYFNLDNLLKQKISIHPAHYERLCHPDNGFYISVPCRYIAISEGDDSISEGKVLSEDVSKEDIENIEINLENISTTKEIEDLLEDAIREEDYDFASKCRDELRRRSSSQAS